jgi:AraC family transcriptional regulator
MKAPAQLPASSWPVTTLSVPGFDVLSGVHEPASVLGRHTHDLPTICCVRYGRFTEYYPGKAVDCDAGTVKITPAGEPHWNRFARVPTFGLRIDVDATRFDGVPEVSRMLDERLFFSAGVFDLVTRQLVLELARGDPLARIAAEGLLLELLARMGRVWETRTPSRPPWLGRADEIIHQTFGDPPSVAHIAALVGVPATRLARVYRSEFGCTIAQRFRQLRLESAARELSATHLPISRIALNAGFYDQSHFSNAFRRHFGVTPAAYRKNRPTDSSRHALRLA